MTPPCGIETRTVVRPSRWRPWLGWLVVWWITTGCGPASPRSSERYIPDEQEARRALVTALDRWKTGQPSPEHPAAPAVLFVDGRYRDGRVLDDYRILAPQPWDRGRRFVVAMTVRPDAEPQKDRFVVLGIDPILVFRQEDFDMLANWMHPMDAPGETGADPKPAAAESASPSGGATP